MEIDLLRRTTSRILAAAAVQVFPNTLLINGSEHVGGFYYDFIFPFVFQKEFITLIEEKMREIAKRGAPIQLLEMVPENAAEFLLHHEQPHRAEIIRSHDGELIEIFQIDRFVDPCPGPYLSDTGGVKAFRLYDFDLLDHNVVRILGTAFFNQQELKDYFRGKNRQSPPSSHLELGKKMDLFSSYGEGRYLFHPKGEGLKQNLLNLWRTLHEEEGFVFLSMPRLNSFFELTQAHLDFVLERPSITFPFKIAEMNYFKEEGAKSMEGLLSTQEYSADAAHIFCTEETLLQMCISSLQFMRKFSKLFPFEIKWVLVPSQKRKKQLMILTEALTALEIEYLIDERKKAAHGPEVCLMIRDGIGREWSGPNLRLECHLLEKVGFQGALIVRSLFPSVERWIALLLEQTQGRLPLWLAPEIER